MTESYLELLSRGLGLGLASETGDKSEGKKGVTLSSDFIFCSSGKKGVTFFTSRSCPLGTGDRSEGKNGVTESYLELLPRGPGLGLGFETGDKSEGKKGVTVS